MGIKIRNLDGNTTVYRDAEFEFELKRNSTLVNETEFARHYRIANGDVLRVTDI